MDIIRYTDEFFSMEKDLKLFSQKINGIPFWDPVRHDVFYFIYYRLAGIQNIKKRDASLLLRGARLLLRRLMLLSLWVKLMTIRYDFLVLRAPRNKEISKNRDIIIDDLLACASGRSLVIDTFPQYYHITPRKSHNFSKVELELRYINAAVEARFGQSIDVASLITQRFMQFREGIKQYDRILSYLRPKYILLVQNGLEKALFYVAHQRNIPVIEAQHGLINYVHPAYSYPSEIAAGSLPTLPTYFLAFSDHWVKQCHYPVAKSIVVGNNNLFISGAKYQSEDILVLSANIYEKTIENVLRPAAITLAERSFVYKLHPNQFEHEAQIRDRLSDLPNVEVISNEKTLRDLFSRCSSVFCVQSTGVYEALQAGLRVYLLAKLDFKTHSDVFDHPGLILVNEHHDFIEAVLHSSFQEDIEYECSFFREFDVDKALNFLNSELL